MGRPDVAIVGASGAVGREVLSILETHPFGEGSVRAIASARSAGQTVRFRGRELDIGELGERAFDGVNLAIFCATSEVARRWAPAAIAAGATVVDNSSAFRMAPDVPLVVPEVNGDVLEDYRGKPAIIANPNCSTIIMLVAVNPLRVSCGVERVSVATYQAVSGAGAAAMDELLDQTRRVMDGEPPRPQVLSEPCAFNVFSHDSDVDPKTGRNVEEQKMMDESRKIWAQPDLKVSATCVRVPVFRAHTEAINVTLSRPAAEHAVREHLGRAPGVRIIDDRQGNDFPTPLKASGGDDVLVGRIRPDESQAREQDRFFGWEMLVCADQLRKGAALNAIQIGEMLFG